MNETEEGGYLPGYGQSIAGDVHGGVHRCLHLRLQLPFREAVDARMLVGRRAAQPVLQLVDFVGVLVQVVGIDDPQRFL